MDVTTPRRRSFAAPLALTVLLAAVAAAPAVAHSVEVAPFYGWRVGGEIEAEDLFTGAPFRLDLDVEEGEAYGLFVDIPVTRNVQVELLFSRQETELKTEPSFFAPPAVLFELDVDYYHAGVLYQWAPGQVRPYVVFTLGATRLDPTGDLLDAETRFTAALGGGVKVLFSEHVGVRFDGRYFSTLIDEEEDLFCDPFGCFDASVSDYLDQGQFSGALLFSF